MFELDYIRRVYIIGISNLNCGVIDNENNSGHRCAGFIGSNFVRLMLTQHPDYRIINVDALTYAGNLENLKDIADNTNYIFIKADIRDREKIETIFNNYEVDFVVNFAAESHVDRSIEEPEIFLTTNVIGTRAA